MRAFPRRNEILLATKAGNEIWSSFNPHTMYNVIKEREEFQEFCKNCIKIMTLSYDFQKIMRENWKYWLSASNQKSPNLQQQFQQILEILRKKLWFRWKKNYGNFERVQAVTRGTSWGLCELQDYKKNFQKFQLQFWEKVCFGGAMILENFKELLILLIILKNVDNEKKCFCLWEQWS